MAVYLITGAARGLGLEIASQLAARPQSEVATVFAATRAAAPTENLRALADKSGGRVQYLQLDYAKDETLEAAVATVGRVAGKLDVLVNNAAVADMHENGLFSVTPDSLAKHFDVNVVAAHKLTLAFLPLLRKSTKKQIFNISTGLASIGQTRTPWFRSLPNQAYKISKTALNMLSAQWASTLDDEGFAVVALSPGWLRTAPSNEAADLSAGEGAEAVLKIMDYTHEQDNGRFRNIKIPDFAERKTVAPYDGMDIPW